MVKAIPRQSRIEEVADIVRGLQNAKNGLDRILDQSRGREVPESLLEDIVC